MSESISGLGFLVVSDCVMISRGWLCRYWFHSSRIPKGYDEPTLILYSDLSRYQFRPQYKVSAFPQREVLPISLHHPSGSGGLVKPLSDPADYAKCTLCQYQPLNQKDSCHVYTIIEHNDNLILFINLCLLLLIQ